MNYTLTQWLFFFFFYCFFGWCFESTYVSICEKRLVNRGFMRGPFLPLYGSGAIMMLVVSIPFREHLPLVFLAGCIGATALEYVTGVVMEALFKVRYWDYSKQPFNYKGYICLSSTIAWGLLTILMTEFLHKPVERFVLGIPEAVLTPAVYVLTVLNSADFALSFKAALDLRDVLVKMEDTKKELLRIQKRLDVLIAVAGEDLSTKREELAEEWKSNLEAVKAVIEERLSEELANRGLGELKEGIEERVASLKEMSELLTQYRHNLAERTRLGKLKDFFQRDMIRSNPTMTSRRFGDALAEVKEAVKNRKKTNED